MSQNEPMDEHWSCKVQQLRALVANTGLGVLSSLAAIRRFKKEGRRLLRDLRSNIQALAASGDPDATSAKVNTDLNEIDFLAALSRAVPERGVHRSRIADLSAEVLDTYQSVPIDLRLNLMANGMGAAIDDSNRRRAWIARIQPIVAGQVLPDPLYDSLAYNFVMALAVDGQREAALAAARLINQAPPTARLLIASLLAAEENKKPCLFFLHAYFGELLADAKTPATSLSEINAIYTEERRALALLTWGYQGIYALVWSRTQHESPVYLHLVPWADAESLRLECGRLPWGRFLNRQMQANPVKMVFGKKDYDLLTKLWTTILNPITRACGSVNEGVDIIPVGWLGLIPWNACGSDPALGDCAGAKRSLAIVPQFCALSSEGTIVDRGRKGLFFISGDYSGNIEEACMAEELAFRKMGFKVIESRADIVDALKKGLVVHFSGHGRNPPPEHGEPYFDLRDGSKLTTSVLHSADIATVAPFVSFSACELGFCYFGEFRDGGIAAGLPTFLVFKGAAACIACQGEVHARVAADYFPDFYRHLFQGKRVGEAARLAFAARTIAGRGKRNLGLWAPFAVYGNQWAMMKPRPGTHGE